MSRILVNGSVAYDYLMTFPGRFGDHLLPDKLDVLSVSFLVDSLRREPGGCATNIAYNLALLGERPTVVATVGQDFADRERLEAAGVDLGGLVTYPDEFTASFFVSTDERNCQLASFYVGAMGRAAELSLRGLAAPGDVAVIAPNSPDAMERAVAECKAMGVAYVYDPSQQIVRLTAEALRAGIEGARLLVANEYEQALIEEKTGLGLDDLRPLVPTLVITHGEHGSRIYDDGTVHDIPIAPAARALDPTGVGDAYRAGLLLGLTRGVPWPVAGRAGALAATYALESVGTQRHAFTPDAFLARYASTFGPPPDALSALLRRRPADLAEEPNR